MGRIRFDAISLALGGVAGALLGGGAVYLYMRRHEDAAIVEGIDAGIADVQAYYNHRLQRLLASPSSNPDERPEAPVGDDPDGTEVLPGSEEWGGVVLPASEVRDPGGAYRSRPYPISFEEFVGAEPGWTQLTFKYYSQDKVLVDDQDEPVTDVANVSGHINRGKFGGRSDDANILYVRNERLEMDIEVCWVDGSYAEQILNYGNPGGR